MRTIEAVIDEAGNVRLVEFALKWSWYAVGGIVMANADAMVGPALGCACRW